MVINSGPLQWCMQGHRSCLATGVTRLIRSAPLQACENLSCSGARGV